jgi:hypothetical protein
MWSGVLVLVHCSFAKVALNWQINCIVSGQKKKIQESMGGGEKSEG